MSLKPVLLATAMLASIATAASAAPTFTFDNSYVATYSSPFAFLSESNVIYPTTATSNGNGRSPFDDQVAPAGNYVSVLGGGFATLASIAGENSFTFYWGSLDTYNTLAISTSAGLFNFSGSDAIFSGLPYSAGGFLTTITLGLGETFNFITFGSTGNSFEFANVANRDVPGPLAGAGLPALLAALGYLGYLKNRKAA